MKRQRNYRCFFGAGAGGSSRPLEVPAALGAASGGGGWEGFGQLARKWQAPGRWWGWEMGGRTEDGGAWRGWKKKLRQGQPGSGRYNSTIATCGRKGCLRQLEIRRQSVPANKKTWWMFRCNSRSPI